MILNMGGVVEVTLISILQRRLEFAVFVREPDHYDKALMEGNTLRLLKKGGPANKVVNGIKATESELAEMVSFASKVLDNRVKKMCKRWRLDAREWEQGRKRAEQQEQAEQLARGVKPVNLTSASYGLSSMIHDFIDEHGKSPTRVEMVKELGWHRSRVERQLKKLEQAGFIDIERNAHRGVKIVSDKEFRYREYARTSGASDYLGLSGDYKIN